MGVPSGLALYWVVSNLLTLVQQYFMLKTSRPASVVAKAPASEAKPKAAAKPVALKSDDLFLIKGIGRKTASVLAAAGITTFADLAAADEEQLSEIMEDADLPPGDYASWIRQAQRRVEGTESS